jgi:hypothetical protein
MSMHYGAKANIQHRNEQFTNFISLGIGVLQGGALAPYLFVIVVDYIMKVALADQSLGQRMELLLVLRALQNI